MRWFWLPVLALAGCSSFPSSPVTDPPGRCAEAGEDAVLYVTHSAGYRHAVLPHSVDVLNQVATEAELALAWEEDARAALTAGGFEGCRAIVFYTSGELPISEAQKQGLLDWIRGGGSFVGLHSATDTFYEWPEYGAMIGGYFDGHPWHQEVRIDPVGASHPITNDLDDPMEITDEIYQFRDFDSGSRVLLELDRTSVNLNAFGVRQHPWGFPLAWTRNEGKGRVFYTALGHGEVWDDPAYRALLAGALRWAAP